MTFLVAYPAAAAPPVLGALRDATGTFTTPFLTLATINLAALTLTRSLPTDTRAESAHHPAGHHQWRCQFNE